MLPSLPQHSCRRFLFFCGNSSLSFCFSFGCSSKHMMREQTLIPSRFFKGLELGRMPIFTRRSRASTFQIISARLSESGTMVTFALDTSFPRPRDNDGSEGVAALCSGFCARSLLSCQKLHWSPSEHWPFTSTGNRYHFLLQRHSFPFDS